MDWKESLKQAVGTINGKPAIAGIDETRRIIEVDSEVPGAEVRRIERMVAGLVTGYTVRQLA